MDMLKITNNHDDEIDTIGNEMFKLEPIPGSIFFQSFLGFII